MFERFGRYIPVISAAIAIVAAIWVLSRIVLTLDTIAHPGYQLAYVAGVVLLLGGFATFTWLKLRRPREPAARPRKLRAPPEARLDELYARHRLDEDRPAPNGRGLPARRSGEGPGTLSVALAGLHGTGRSAIAAALADASARAPAAKPLQVELRELDGLDTDRGRNLERLAPAAAADVTLFVVDQDLRDYEQAAIQAMARRNVRLIVVINKTDLMRAEALAETRLAIAGKLAGLLAETDIVNASGAPKPLVRMVGEGGRVYEQEVARAPDVAAILDRLALVASERGRRGVRISFAPT